MSHTVIFYSYFYVKLKFHFGEDDQNYIFLVIFGMDGFLCPDIFYAYSIIIL